MNRLHCQINLFLFFMLLLNSSTVIAQDEMATMGPPAESGVNQTPQETKIEPYVPEISPGQIMTLEEAIEAADRRNLTLNTARIEIEKADAQLSQAWGLVLPVAQGSFQYMRNDHADTVNFNESLGPLYESLGIPAPEGGDMIIRPQDMFTGSLQVMLPIINAQSWYSISIAKKGTELAQLSVEGARQQLLLMVAQAYFVTVMSHSLIELFESQLSSAEHHMKIADDRLSAGDGVRIDVIRAETELEKAKQQLIVSHRAFENARDTLGVITGVGGLPMPHDPPPLHTPTESEKDLISKASDSRPDIRAKKKAVELSEGQLNAAWMQFLPTLDAAWQLQYQFTDPPDLGSDDRSRWAAMLTMTIPIYNHFRYAELDGKKASLSQARLKEQDAQTNLALEIRKARREYLSALSSAAIAENQARLANEALQLVETSFEAGTGSSLEVTDARRTASAANVNMAAERLKAQIVLLSLLHAIGEDMTTLSQERKR